MGKLKITNYQFTFILLMLSILLSFTGYATTYYVSTSGNDSNPGTSEELPWRSLDKINKYFKLFPGDQILFERGEVWTGTIIARISGTKSNPIIYGAYGTGEKPKIYNSEIATEWTLHSGNIYKATFNKAEIKQLFLNGSRMKMARYPDEGYYPITTAKNTTQFISTSLDNGINYDGATCILRNNAYSMYAIDVKKSGPQTINLNSPPVYPLKSGYGFWLTNKLEFLTAPGEWYYDNKANTLYFWTPNGDSPANYEIRLSTINYGVYISKQNYITVKDLEILHSGIDGIKLAGSDYTTIDNCNILYSDLNGVSFTDYGCDYTTVKNCTIFGSNSKGIISLSHNALITGNTIEETGQLANINKVADGMIGTGIYSRYDNSVIEYNRIINSGYSGINFSGINTNVRYNYVNGACQVLDDGGGIYVTSGTTSYPKNSFTIGSVIDHNIVLNVFGNRTGSLNTNNDSGVGIYLDWEPKDVSVTNNTISGTTYGMLVNGGGLHRIKHNTFIDGMILLRFKEESQKTDKIEFKNNVLYQTSRLGNHAYSSKTTHQKLMLPNETGTTFDNDSNLYIAHYYSDEIFKGSTDFANWKAETGTDYHSKFDGTPLSQGETEKLFYNDTKQTKIFYLENSVFQDIYGNQIKDTFLLKPFTSKILIGKNFNLINQKPDIQDQSYHIISPKISNNWIGQVFVNDPDFGQIISFSIIYGNEAGFFAIDSFTGNISTKTDIQTVNNISTYLVIQVKDNSPNTLSDTALITIHVIGTDISPPEINYFSIPAAAISLTIPISYFIATDNVRVTGYSLTETPDLPNSVESAWSTSIPVNFTFSNEGFHVLYSWVKDSAGNISNPVIDSIFILLPDMSPTFSTYLFEESSGNTIIDSGGSNNGTFVNYDLRVPGVIGNGVEFDGNNYINLGKSFGENVETGLTLSLWIKPVYNENDYQELVVHEGSGSDTYALYLYPKEKGIGFKTSGTTDSLTIIGNANWLWDGNWHHLAVTFNGHEKVIYLDNVALSKSDATGIIDSGWKYNLYLGAGNKNEVTEHFYKGFMDEVRIYNYGLTDFDIGELYHPVNKIINKIYTTEYISICEGEEYFGLIESGTYLRTLKRLPENFSQVDSVISTFLSVNPTYHINSSTSICEGDTYHFGNQNLSVSGEYTHLFQTVHGCDSVVKLNLIVHQQYDIHEEVAISPDENYLGWTTEGNYQRILISSAGCDSIVFTDLKIREEFIQQIKLDKGWNIFSSNIIPNDMNMDSVLKSFQIDETLVMVLDEEDNSFKINNTGTQWINAIGNLRITEGYKINVTSPSLLEIEGTKVSFPLLIPIKKGLNLVSFPNDEPSDAMEIIKPLIQKGILEKVQDEKGNSIEKWNSLGWINGIGNFYPGEGYIIQSRDTGFITIPEIYKKSTILNLDKPKTTYFRVNFEGNGFNHMNVNIIGLNMIALKPGDEVATFDGDICVGTVKLTDYNLEMNSVSIAASASDGNNFNGFVDGNHVIVKSWSAENNVEMILKGTVLTGKMVFKNHFSVFLQLDSVPNSDLQMTIYPNPANNKVFVQFNQLPKKDTQIVLYDITGKMLFNKFIRSNPEIISTDNLPSGMYLIRTSLNNKDVVLKLIISKYSDFL